MTDKPIALPLAAHARTRVIMGVLAKSRVNMLAGSPPTPLLYAYVWEFTKPSVPTLDIRLMLVVSECVGKRGKCMNTVDRQELSESLASSIASVVAERPDHTLAATDDTV